MDPRLFKQFDYDMPCSGFSLCFFTSVSFSNMSTILSLCLSLFLCLFFSPHLPSAPSFSPLLYDTLSCISYLRWPPWNLTCISPQMFQKILCTWYCGAIKKIIFGLFSKIVILLCLWSNVHHFIYFVFLIV